MCNKQILGKSKKILKGNIRFVKNPSPLFTLDYSHDMIKNNDGRIVCCKKKTGE